MCSIIVNSANRLLSNFRESNAGGGGLREKGWEWVWIGNGEKCTYKYWEKGNDMIYEAYGGLVGRGVLVVVVSTWMSPEKSQSGQNIAINVRWGLHVMQAGVSSCNTECVINMGLLCLHLSQKQEII